MLIPQTALIFYLEKYHELSYVKAVLELIVSSVQQSMMVNLVTSSKVDLAK